MSIQTIQADYKNAQHASDIVTLLNHYACDPMGGGQGLDAFVKNNLIAEMQNRPFLFSILAYVDSQAVGLANCIESFSTFKSKAVVNIHDMVVHPDFRAQGVSQAVLSAIEARAHEIDACKITLEVLSGNKAARGAYEKFGFEGYVLDPDMGEALFWEKPIEE